MLILPLLLSSVNFVVDFESQLIKSEPEIKLGIKISKSNSVLSALSIEICQYLNLFKLTV